MNLTITEIVKGNFAHFDRYRKGILYYRVVVLSHSSHDDTFEFPVPIEDCGDATFPTADKAIMFMRYIRKAISDETFIKV